MASGCSGPLFSRESRPKNGIIPKNDDGKKEIEFRGKVDLHYPFRFPDSVEFLYIIYIGNSNQNQDI